MYVHDSFGMNFAFWVTIMYLEEKKRKKTKLHNNMHQSVSNYGYLHLFIVFFFFFGGKVWVRYYL